MPYENQGASRGKRGHPNLRKRSGPGRWNNRPGADWVVVTRQRPIARAWKDSSLVFEEPKL